MTHQEKARDLLHRWKGDRFAFGMGALSQAGALCARLGKTALIIAKSGSATPVAEAVADLLSCAGIRIAGGSIVEGARPNAPREDVYRIETHILHRRPEMIVAVGGGSNIDACKAANALAAVGWKTPELDAYFGTGLVKQAILEVRRAPLPLFAVQTAASSAAHLTKYANVTDPATWQKKLIIDEAIVPPVAVFDYETTLSAPPSLTREGVLDTLAHTFESFCGAKGGSYALEEEIAVTAISLLAQYAPRLAQDPGDREAREAVGLASDLGGYAIMAGGTSGAHLNSFSLVDIASHGTACGILNPYYAVFYGSAIARQLRTVGAIFAAHGFLDQDPSGLEGRALSCAVARAMMAFNQAIGAPVTLGELPGFSSAHIERCLSAAKDPQLRVKLQNMPVAMTPGDVDEYMRPVLEAAAMGVFDGIREKE